MKKFFTVSTAIAALLLGATSASALDESKGMYVAGEGENRMVMGGDMTEGARVLSGGENGAAPSDCPAGSFYEGGNNTIMACEGGTAFNLQEPGEGMMMSNGEAYPEGSMMMMQGEGAVEGSIGVEGTTGSNANAGTDGAAASSGN